MLLEFDSGTSAPQSLEFENGRSPPQSPKRAFLTPICESCESHVQLDGELDETLSLNSSSEPEQSLAHVSRKIDQSLKMCITLANMLATVVEQVDVCKTQTALCLSETSKLEEAQVSQRDAFELLLQTMSAEFERSGQQFVEVKRSVLLINSGLRAEFSEVREMLRSCQHLQQTMR